jgi:hypothetical protein
VVWSVLGPRGIENHRLLPGTGMKNRRPDRPRGQDHGRWSTDSAGSNPTRPLPRAGGPRQRCRHRRCRASPCSRVGAYAARPHERHPCRPCHYRAIHNGRERSHADTHGQFHGRHDLRRSSSGQVATLPDLALPAGGRLVAGLDRLAVPGRCGPWSRGDRGRTASATGRDRRSRAGVREPQLCDDSHAELSPRPDGTPAMPRNKAVPNR